MPSLPSGWSELPFHLSQVDSGISPYIVGINGKHEVFSLGANNILKKIDGTMHHVSSGQSGVWAVGLLGNVFFRKGTEPDAEGKFRCVKIFRETLKEVSTCLK